jgi:hypothetical protein
MQNTTKTREVLTQIRLCCLEIAHGCEQMETHEFRPEDLDMLARAVWELHLAVKPIVKVNPELDHDGDTLPANEPPEQPVCKCGHAHRDHMPASFTAEPSGAIAAAMLGFSAGCCIYCLCERFDP